MPVDNALDGRQANAVPRKLFRRVKTLESAKQLIRVSHVKTRAVIPDKIGRKSFGIFSSHFDRGFRASAGKFPGVANEIFQHSPQQLSVSLNN